jgi:3-oxoacyl-[acyl-carrier-protein] synthase-3
MRFDGVCIEAFGHVIPERVVRSEEIEARLALIYDRLNLSIGRLELMSGIRERRFFEPGTRPSEVAARAGAIALEKSGIDRAKIGCLIHASVCRDFLEPATASVVHHALELPARCSAFDLSNACLGFANAMMVIASMIERREIEAGLVVAGEDGGPLLQATIRALIEDERAGRAELKRAHASLTIGSGAAAVVLAHRSIARGPRERRRLVGGTSLSDTRHHVLCHGDRAEGYDGPLMQTDSEALMQAGNELAARTWLDFQRELGWSRGDVDRVVTHQVGVAHRKLLFSTLELDPELDFPTVETLGNIGSVSLPLSFSLALERGFIRDGDKVALLGIGSGLHCLMLGVQW